MFNCPNCNKPGPHFVTPSLGERGFYTCDNSPTTAARPRDSACVDEHAEAPADVLTVPAPPQGKTLFIQAKAGMARAAGGKVYTVKAFHHAPQPMRAPQLVSERVLRAERAREAAEERRTMSAALADRARRFPVQRAAALVTAALLRKVNAP